MKNLEFIPYTYLIGWSKHNIWYYGEQHRNSKYKVANPSNLWNTYFTSSKYVQKFRKEYGEPDIIEIRRIFKAAKEARLWETKVLRRIKAKYRSDFLNKHDNVSVYHDLEIRQKISLANTNRFKGKTYEEIYGFEKAQELKEKRSKQWKGKSNKGILNPMFGRNHSEETKQKQRDIRQKDARRGQQHHYFNKKRDPETRQKISETLGQKCTDGINVFHSIKAMAQFHNCIPETMQYRIKSGKTQFRVC